MAPSAPLMIAVLVMSCLAFVMMRRVKRYEVIFRHREYPNL